MTVAELIKVLQTKNPEALVVRDDVDSEFLISEVHELRELQVRLLAYKNTAHVQFFEAKPLERRGWHSVLGAVDAVIIK
jgi:hypothetical protein